MRETIYNAGFAQVYNVHWARFANTVAPSIRDFYERTPISRSSRAVLDICCGTGQLALHFLEQGYTVVGLDLSPAMLEHARINCQSYMDQAHFISGDAADFHLDAAFGLAVSTYDALNHLPDSVALAGCCRSAYTALLPGGWFIFDLNTRQGLRQWSGMNVQDMDDLTLITRGVAVTADDRMYTQITGFVRQADGSYMRVDQTAFNTAFDLDAVADLLRDAGFRGVYCALVAALDTPLENPELESRVFFIAQKPRC
jgi:SAM-dependent methyltransferase